MLLSESTVVSKLMSSIVRPVCLLPDYTQHQLEQVVGEHVLSPRFLETQPSTMMKHDDCVNHRQNELFNVHGRTLYRSKILIHLQTSIKKEFTWAILNTFSPKSQLLFWQAKLLFFQGSRGPIKGLPMNLSLLLNVCCLQRPGVHPHWSQQEDLQQQGQGGTTSGHGGR